MDNALPGAFDDFISRSGIQANSHLAKGRQNSVLMLRDDRDQAVVSVMAQFFKWRSGLKFIELIIETKYSNK